MKLLIGILFSPMAFAVGFLWPLSSQAAIAMQLAESGWPAVIAGATVAIPFGLIAQLRGSWVWVM